MNREQELEEMYDCLSRDPRRTIAHKLSTFAPNPREIYCLLSYAFHEKLSDAMFELLEHPAATEYFDTMHSLLVLPAWATRVMGNFELLQKLLTFDKVISTSKVWLFEVENYLKERNDEELENSLFRNEKLMREILKTRGSKSYLGNKYINHLSESFKMLSILTNHRTKPLNAINTDSQIFHEGLPQEVSSTILFHALNDCKVLNEEDKNDISEKLRLR